MAGEIYTSSTEAAGLIAKQFGTVNIRNCRSSVIIHSTKDGNGTHGGLVGAMYNAINCQLTIEGCVFDGKILNDGGTTTDCSGFVGYKYDKSTLTISNSLYAPAALGTGEAEPTSNSATFARYSDGHAATITNCYYTRTLGTAQGKQAYCITADNYVTVENAGTATTYSTSGITSYGTGILYDNVLYAGNGDEVSLTLSNSIGGDVPEGYQYAYSTNAGTLDGSTLTMPDADVIVSVALRSTGQFVYGIDYYINNDYTSTAAIALDGTESSLGKI